MTDYEFYPTPRWCVRRILERLEPPPSDLLWLDPCVGAGAIPDAVSAYYGAPQAFTNMDIVDRGYPNTIVCDYLRHEIGSRRLLFDVCIMNPPFSKALQFAERARSMSECVIMLQRLNWLASADRNSWLRAHMPDVKVLPDRVSFAGGTADNQEYAWFVWAPHDISNGVGTIEVLPCTDAKLRDKGDAPIDDSQQELAIDA